MCVNGSNRFLSDISFIICWMIMKMCEIRRKTIVRIFSKLENGNEKFKYYLFQVWKRYKYSVDYIKYKTLF